MITEAELEKLSWPDAPQMKTRVPGPLTRQALERSARCESLARGGGEFPLVFDKGFGATVSDPDGNLYIDVSAGVGVTSVGRCHPAVVAAIHAQSQYLMHASDITNSRRIELAERIAAIMPDGLRANCVTYFTQSGSDAVEAAVKFAKRVTGRQQILAFHGAYHGVWNASNALTTGNQYRSGYGPFMGGVIHAPYPYGYRSAFDTSSKSAEQAAGEYVDYLLNTRYTAADDVAAVIVEPVQGEGGYIAPEPEFLQLVRKACDRAGALLIADEVQAGAGRTGKMWSIEHSGVKPDLLTFGKGMGGDLPMAGVALRADLARHIPPGSQPGTFAANALSAAVCLSNIELLTDPKLALIERAHRLGLETLERLRAADCPLIGEVRGRGLMIGIELVEDRASKTPLAPEKVGGVVVESLNRGIVMVPCGRNGNVLRLMPALTIPRRYLFGALDRVLAVLAEV